MRIHAQHVVTVKPRMNMDVQMRNLLEGRFADRMPEAYPFVRERRADRSSHSRYRGHESSARNFVELADIVQMRPRHHQRVSRMKLAKIDKRHR